MAKQAAFAIPSLTDVDPEYKDLISRQSKLNERIGGIRRELGETEAAITAERAIEGPRLRSSVAELLGDADMGAVDRRKKLRELRQAEHDHEEALDVISKRLSERLGRASHAVIAAVQGEIDKRVGAVALATVEALVAKNDLEALILGLEAEGCATDSLRGNVMPFFLTNGQAERYVAEHKGGANG